MNSSPENRMKSMRPRHLAPAAAGVRDAHDQPERDRQVQRRERLGVAARRRTDRRWRIRPPRRTPPPARGACRGRAAASTRNSRSAGAGRRDSGCGRRSSASASNCSPKSAGTLMATAAATARQKATMASVRAAACGSPVSEGDDARVASRGGPSARARTPARGRRGRPCASPPPGTPHRRRAPRRSAPLSARAGGPPAPPHRRSGSPAGDGGSSATGRSAPRAIPRDLEPASSGSLWQWRG